MKRKILSVLFIVLCGWLLFLSACGNVHMDTGRQTCVTEQMTQEQPGMLEQAQYDVMFVVMGTYLEGGIDLVTEQELLRSIQAARNFEELGKVKADALALGVPISEMERLRFLFWKQLLHEICKGQS